MERLSSALVPGDGGLTLVRNTYRFNVGASINVDKLTTIPFDDLVVALDYVPIDHHWIVFAPAWVVTDLLVLPLCAIDNFQVLVDQEDPRTRGALVDCHHIPWLDRGGRRKSAVRSKEGR